MARSRYYEGRRIHESDGCDLEWRKQALAPTFDADDLTPLPRVEFDRSRNRRPKAMPKMIPFQVGDQRRVLVIFRETSHVE